MSMKKEDEFDINIRDCKYMSANELMKAAKEENKVVFDYTNLKPGLKKMNAELVMKTFEDIYNKYIEMKQTGKYISDEQIRHRIRCEKYTYRWFSEVYESIFQQITSNEMNPIRKKLLLVYLDTNFKLENNEITLPQSRKIIFDATNEAEHEEKKYKKIITKQEHQQEQQQQRQQHITNIKINTPSKNIKKK